MNQVSKSIDSQHDCFYSFKSTILKREVISFLIFPIMGMLTFENFWVFFVKQFLWKLSKFHVQKSINVN